MENWLTFRDYDTDTVASWEEKTSGAISRVSGRNIEVKLRLPTMDDARAAWENNVNLLGRIEFFGDFEGGVEIALPFDGVFLARSANGIHPNRLAWDNCLVERPGIRLIRIKEEGDKDKNLLFRIGCVNGDSLDVPISAKKGSKKFSENTTKLVNFAKRRQFDLSVNLQPECFPAWFRSVISDIRNEDPAPSGEGVLKRLLGDVQKYKTVIEKFDREDIAHRAVMSFPKWLQYRLCDRFFCCKNVLGKMDVHDFLYALVPLVGKGVCGESDGSGCEFVYAPVENAIDFASRLYSVKRFRVKRKLAQLYSVGRRQNHVSFEGCLCPIESPESELVGISLQLARGARIDADGVIVKAESDVLSNTSGSLSGSLQDGFQPFLGWGASMIPFLHHNDDARNMMGAKNIRQALLVQGRDVPVVRTGGEKALMGMAGRLLDIGICPGRSEESVTDGLALGCDLLVAYMPWYGWNVDDAIVVSDTICEKMAVVKTKEFARFVDAGWVVETDPKYYAGHDVFESERELHKGDAVVILHGPGDVEQRIVYADDAKAFVTVNFPRNGLADGVCGRLRYTIKRMMPLGVGDKLMGRHGNKGVVSKVVPKDQMPRLPDGRAVEILLNPHGVLSRMNPGQLLETHLGWLIKEGRCKAETICESNCEIGYPEKGLVRHDKVRELLKDDNLGMNQNGAVLLSWDRDGANIKSSEPIVIGYQYFVRLNHIPELKAQARHGGWNARYSPISCQAAHGRSVGGGQRVGEMEMWGLRAHTADSIIDEMIGEKSDAMEVRRRHQGENLLEQYLPNELRNSGVFEHGFGRYMRTWLRALLIDVNLKDGKLVFNRMPCDSSEALMDYMHGIGCAMGVVTSYKGQLVRKGMLICPTCGVSLGNGHEFTWRPDTEYAKFKVKDLLREFGLKCARIEKTESGCLAAVVIDDAGQPAGKLIVEEETSNGNQGLCLKIDTCGVAKGRLPDVVPSFFCFYEKGTRSRSREDIKKDLINGSLSLEKINVVCSIHKKKGGNFELAVSSDADATGGVMGGLQSKDVFGEDVFCELSDEKWGCIKLPFQIDGKPLLEQVLKKFKCDRGIKSMSEFKIGAIPVLPRRFRLPRLANGLGKIGGAAELDYKGYGPILDACAKFGKDLDNSNKVDVERKVNDLFCLLLDRLIEKEGLLRYDGLGRRVDRSFRLVIAPDPTLRIDECGVPEDILWEVLRPRQKSKARQLHGYAHYVGWSWKVGTKEAQIKRNNLNKYLREHPDVRIILNRQPSLHRDSILSFRPIPINRNKDGANSVILRLPPLCCKCFAADFDGDEMVGHAVLSEKASIELKRMTLKDNLLAVDGYDPSRPEDCDLTCNIDRDFVSGLALLQRTGKLTEECRFGGWSNKAEMVKSLNAICRNPDEVDASGKIYELMQRAFDVVTRCGCSFGFYDLLDCVSGAKNECEMFPLAANEKMDECARNIVQKHGGMLELLVGSGANGDKQIRQFIVGRGELLPCKDRFCCTLVDGMSWTDLFRSSWNARSSMCDKKLGTARAGGLTRALVFLLQGVRIVEEACTCEDSKRSILHCKCKDGICAECYGNLPNGKLAKTGFPAGLIAALAIGERGTQVSMKSAHSGGGENNFEAVRRLIFGDQGRPKDFDEFYDAIVGNDDKGVEALAKDYSSVARRHFEILWRRMCGGVQSMLDDLVLKRESQMRLLAGVWSGKHVKMSINAEESAHVMFGLRR